jgi:hypothetical protein
MTTNPAENGLGNSEGVGTITREMVEARAAELAVINGHAARHHLSGPEWEQAKLELPGDSDPDRPGQCSNSRLRRDACENSGPQCGVR